MTKLFFTTALAMSALCLQAQTVVSLDKAGTLSKKISSAEKYEITNLKISGPLNGTDFILLRDMAGMDQENNKSNGTLETLDLTDASIVKGGEPYYVSYGGNADTEYYTSDNEMGHAMFIKCATLKDVKLPTTVTAIGDSCFLECKALSNLDIPASVKEIGSYALSYTALEKFSFPEGMAITEGVLSGCSSLISLTIPSDVTVIPRDAFSGTGIQEIELPKSLTKIGEEAFSASLITKVNCPENLLTIDAGAFSLCPNLTEVNFNNKLETIGNRAFSSCESLLEANIPNTVTTLGSSAFKNCI